jgi:hypothetical protein
MRDVRAEVRTGLRELRDTVRRNRTVARELRGASYTRLAERFWPVVEFLGILLVTFSAAIGAVPFLIGVFYLLLGFLFGAVQSVLAMLLEEYAFQRKTDTGLLLGRYALSIIAQIGYRLRTSLTRIFS